jgi:isoleucyl-tRNA synthetase
VLPADFVTTEDGTGIVHMAPAYGEDDAAVGRRYGLPTIHPIDRSGRFVEGPRAGAVAGKPAKEADKDILRALKADGALFRQETLVHAYPHCWRCDTPLLYYARDSWYVRTTAFKDRMVEHNRTVRWHPAAVGEGRFGQWLENNVDWAFSRDRYWGTPIPVWRCDAEACGAETAVGSVEELRRLAGRLPEPLDLHRPHVDALAWPCAAAGCRGTMRRTPEIADVWFDSGAMPFAQWHYPFENRERVEREVPADFIAEAVDQTRGWFYTLLAVSTLYKDRPAYREVVSTDLILDAAGKKMSKSRGNAVVPDALFREYGADVVRWHLLTSRPLWLPLKFDERDLKDVRNRFFGTLASTYAFFSLYANADGWTAEPAKPASGNPFDRWLLSRLDGLVEDVAAEVADYETSKAGKRIADFVVEDLSNWWVRRNRRRVWKGALSDDKRAAYGVLREALLGVSRLVAPFAPFLADTVHRALDGRPGVEASVHLAAFPKPAGRRDEALEARMEALRTVVSLGRGARAAAKVKVRQPLSAIAVGGGTADDLAFLRANEDAIREELNVRSVRFEPDLPDRTVFRVALDKREAGRRLGARTASVERALAALDATGVRALVLGTAPGGRRVRTAEGEDVPLAAGDLRVETQDGPDERSAFAGGFVVRLDTRLSEDLRAEGLVREFVHAAQALRKARGLQVTDRIRLRWAAPDALAAALRGRRATVAEELLATDVSEASASDLSDAAVVDVDGAEARVAIEAAAG